MAQTRKEKVMAGLFAEVTLLAWVVFVLVVTGEAGAGRRWP